MFCRLKHIFFWTEISYFGYWYITYLVSNIFILGRILNKDYKDFTVLAIKFMNLNPLLKINLLTS